MKKFTIEMKDGGVMKGELYEDIAPETVANFEKLILPEKNRLRVEYAKTQSFPLDCRLMLETIKGVFGKAEDMAKERRQ